MADVNEMMADLQAADAAGDTALSQHIAGLIKAQQGGAPPQDPGQTVSPLTVTPDPRKAVGLYDFGPKANAVVDPIVSGAQSFSHNLFGVGDVAGAIARMGVQAAHGNPVDYSTASKQYQAQRNYLAQAHPIANIVGGVGGAIDGGVLGGGVAKAAGLVTPVTNALAATEGQIVGNLAKLGAGGAIAGAAQGAAQGAGETAAQGGSAGQVAGAAVKGGLGGAVLGGVAAPVVGTAIPAVAKAIAPLATKTALQLGKLMGESADDVAGAWNTFTQQTGRAPTMTELAGLKAQADIKRAAGQNPAIGEALVGAQDSADQARVGSMQAQVSGAQPAAGPVQPGSPQLAPIPPAAAAVTPPVTGKQDVLNATTARGDIEYGAAREHSFTIPTEDEPELDGVSPADHLAAQVVPLAGLRTADQVRIRNGLRDGNLSGQDAQLVRSGLGAAQTRAYSPAIATAQADLEHYLAAPGNEAANDALETATSNYAQGRAAAEGTEKGQQIVSAKNTPDYLAQVRAQPEAAAAATPQGVMAALHTSAQTPASATNLAQALATDTGLHSRLSATLGGPTADALRELGVRETSAADALSATTPRTPAPETGADAAMIQTAIHGLAAVASHGVWFKALHAAKVLTGTGMSEAVAQRVAGYLADPAMTGQGIALLRKAGADNQALRNLSLTAAGQAGVIGGAAAGDLAGPQP